MTRSTKRRTRRARRPVPLSDSRDSEHIRPARVLAARARIASGHYERPEVREFLLDALLEELRRH